MQSVVVRHATVTFIANGHGLEEVGLRSLQERKSANAESHGLPSCPPSDIESNQVGDLDEKDKSWI